MPAACVRVANSAPRARIAASVRQSSAKPADGGSNATGGPAIRVHTSQSASGTGTCAYWMGCPWRASPAQTSSGAPSNRSDTRRGCPSDRSTLARRGPRTNRSPGERGGGADRSSVRVRKSPSPKTTALKRLTSSGLSEGRPASRTSTGLPVPACTPRRLAGSVAASLATTRSPGRRNSTKAERGAWPMRRRASTTRSLACGGRCTGRSAAIIWLLLRVRGRTPAAQRERRASGARRLWRRPARGPPVRAASASKGRRRAPPPRASACPCRRGRAK